jgi:thiamine biosynthesis protein ThiS
MKLHRMRLQINGDERDFDNASSPFTLAALIETLGMKADRVAVELNLDIVPRDRWAATQLNEGDRLEVVHFVGGGSCQALLSGIA